MNNLIIFMLVCVGLTNIIQNEVIFSPIREYLYNNYVKIYNFISCPTCAGFWLGMLTGIFIPIITPFILNLVVCGVISSLLNKIFGLIIPDIFGKI